MELPISRDWRAGNRFNLKWTREHDDALGRHVAATLTFVEIAARLNAEFGTAYTRSSIGGRMMRLGLKSRNPPHIRLKAVKAPRKRSVSKPRVDRPKAPIPSAAIIKLRCAEIVPLHVTLLDLEPHHCRYPFGEGPFTFCGNAKQEGSSYCNAHFHLCLGDPRGRHESNDAQIASLKKRSRSTLEVLNSSKIDLRDLA